jgi:DNA-directed RNA polymerase subunit RPC12/RpoP
MKYFCSKCGKTTQYNFELPKFCSFCGQSFATKQASTEAEENRNKFLNELKLKKNINSFDLEDETSYVSESNINFKQIKPSFKVDVYQNKGESLGSLLENPSKPIEMNKNSPVNTKSREKILEEFQKEAGSLRSK